MSQDHAADRQAQLDRARAIASTPATYDQLVLCIANSAERPWPERGWGELARIIARSAAGQR